MFRYISKSHTKTEISITSLKLKLYEIIVSHSRNSRVCEITLSRYLQIGKWIATQRAVFENYIYFKTSTLGNYTVNMINQQLLTLMN